MAFLDFVDAADGERVLDVGCGTGHLAFAVAGRSPGSEIRAVDFAPAYIEYANRNNQSPRVHFTVGDACALEFPSQSFDRVLSLLVLHFVPQPEKAIAEMCRVAKPGGVVGAAVWDARGGFVANRLFFDTAATLDPKANARRARNYTRPMTRPGELPAAWRAAGFDNLVETELCIRIGPGAEYVMTLGAAERSKLEDAVKAAYLDGEVDGPRSFAALAWAVIPFPYH